ncbi:MAG: methylated-DNA--[protein]-cysteine S-methyltransferase [Myxococcaceae bacterium]
MELFTKTMTSPVGPLRLFADDEALVGVYFSKTKDEPPEGAKQVKSHPMLDRAERELREYFAGKRKDFDVPLRPQGTDFQRQVWKQLSRIPFGERISYAELAKRIGNPKAMRAVGSANGCNPIPIIVPCHRVVGADGSLTGFGGGIANKRILLDHEQVVLGNAVQQALL